MKAILAFLSSSKHIIKWTLCYIAIMWVILYILFDFDMTSIHQWNRLIHAQLTGFGGFVFGILILAMVPMYIATTTVILRNKKPLFTIPIPECVRRAFAPPAPPPPATPDTEPETKPANATTPDSDIYNMPKHIPTELHGAFIRVRNGTGRPQVSTFNTLNMAATNTSATNNSTTDTAADDFPIPTDFGMDDNAFGGDFSSTPSMPSMPTFSDITFDTPAPAPADTAPDTPDNAITKTLHDAGIEFSIDGDIILTDKMAIAIHDDPDFWIADDENWFADGRTRPSPIAALTAHTGNGTRTAVLYAATTNILDFDNMRTKWESNGIRVITSPTEILN